MQISDQYQRYLLALGSLIVVVYFIYYASTDNFTCDGWANDFRDSKEFHLILIKKENNQSRDAYFYGIDLKNKENTKFHDGGGWIARNFEKFNIGDTLLKDVGKYSIIIKREGKTILIPFKCGEKIYIDKK